MKRMCHSLRARGREEIGEHQSGEEGRSCMVASPRAPPGISGGPRQGRGFLTEACSWAGIWQDQGRDGCQQPLRGSSEWAEVVLRLQASTPLCWL